MKKRSAKQIKNLIIALILLMVVVLISLIVFIFNVKVNNEVENQDIENQEQQTQSTSNSYYKLDVDKMDTNLENINITYNLVKYDEDGIFKFTLEDNKIYFQIKDNDKFQENYQATKLNFSKKNEVITHDYKIVDFTIGKIQNDLYLVVVTDNGSIGYMNIDEAIGKNVFRIKNELKTFDSNVMQIQNAIKIIDSKESNTIVVITSDEKNYDLESLISE